MRRIDLLRFNPSFPQFGHGGVAAVDQPRIDDATERRQIERPQCQFTAVPDISFSKMRPIVNAPAWTRLIGEVVLWNEWHDQLLRGARRGLHR